MKKWICLLAFFLPMIVYADCAPDTMADFGINVVTAPSDKDLSNVVIKFCDGTVKKYLTVRTYTDAVSARAFLTVAPQSWTISGDTPV